MKLFPTSNSPAGKGSPNAYKKYLVWRSQFAVALQIKLKSDHLPCGAVDLVVLDLNLAIVDLLDHVVSADDVALVLDRAADGLAGAENFTDSAAELLGHGLEAELLGDSNDVLEGDGAGVDKNLTLRDGTSTLVQVLDDLAGGGWEDEDSWLSLLAVQLDRDLDTLVGTGGSKDLITDDLWWKTIWTDLWGDSLSWEDDATSNAEVDIEFRVWINLWWHESRKEVEWVPSC